MVGTMLGGYLFDTFGPGRAFTIKGLANLILCVWFLLIKDRIKQIIESENFKKPYNDQVISEMLRKDGFIVARRTVAKYREQMMIPVARLRRKI